MARPARVRRTRGGARLIYGAREFYDSVGVNAHIYFFDTSYADLTQLKTLIADLGVAHIRDVAVRSPTDTNFNDAVYTRWRTIHADTGAKVQFCFDPRFFSDGTLTAADLDWVYEQTNGNVERLEGPNELDNSGIPTWATDLPIYVQNLFTQANASLHCSTLPIVAPPLVQDSSFTTIGDISAYTDFTNAHPYPGGRQPGTSYIDSTLTNARKLGPNQKITHSESGYHNALNVPFNFPAINENVGGKYTPRMCLEFFRRGVVRTHLYELIDLLPNTALDNDQYHFGLARTDGTKKPAFTALKNLLAHFNEPVPAGSWAPTYFGHSVTGGDSDLRKLLFQRASDGKYLMVLWQEKSSWDYDPADEVEITNPDQTVTISFANLASQVRVFRPKDSASPTTTVTSVSSHTVSVPDHPVVVEIS